MEIVFLGTSSAAPTLRRGLSSTAVLHEGETILFDCGEATQFQMIRRRIPRRKFHHILISHLHGDHVFGLGGLLSTLNLGQRTYPLHIHGPRGIRRFVEFMTGFPRPTRMGFEIHVHELAPGFRGEVYRGAGYRVHATPLVHAVTCFGYRLQEDDQPGRFDDQRARELGVPFGPERGRLTRGEAITLEDGRTVQPADVVGAPRRGRSVVYCLDTTPCEAAVSLAREADVLIHEATFADEHADMARDRKHSTIAQAAVIANEARVAAFVATHFSTRYEGPALEGLEAEGRAVRPDLVMARDGLRLEVPIHG